MKPAMGKRIEAGAPLFIWKSSPLTSAKQALALISAGEQFEVILSDVMMPEMSGMELHDPRPASRPSRQGE